MPLEQRLVFRFYGAFTVTRENLPAIKLPHGTLDVIDLRDSLEAGASQTLLRWQLVTRDEQIGEGDLSIAPNWHSHPDDVWSQLTDVQNDDLTEASFFINAPVGVAPINPLDALKLLFTGISAMDRIRPDTMAARRPVVDMRIPCVPSNDRDWQSWFRVGVASRPGTADHVYAFRLMIPMPANFGSASKQKPFFPLGCDFLTSQPDSDQLQRPFCAFTPEFSDNQILHDFNENGPRFGDFYNVDGADFSFEHRASDTRINIPNVLLIGAHSALENLNLVDKNATPMRPSNTSWRKHQIRLQPSTTGIGIMIWTRSVVGGAPLDLRGQLGLNIPSPDGIVVTTEIDITTTEAQLRAPDQNQPFRCTGRITLQSKAVPDESFRLTDADGWMARERDALAVTKAAPQSFLPSLVFDQPRRNVPFYAAVAVRVRMEPTTEAVFEPDPALGPRVAVCVTLDDTSLFDSLPPSIPIGVAFPGIDPDAPTIDGHSFHLKLIPDTNVTDPNFRPTHSAIRFRIKNRDVLADIPGNHQTPFSGRLGSLGLRGVDGPEGVPLLVDGDPGNLELRPDTSGPNHKGVGQDALSISLPIALANVQPVASDLPHGDRDTLREDWLIPTGKGQAEGQHTEASFVLQVEESLSPEQDHHLVANLFETGPGGVTGFDDVLVTRAPFGMMRLRRPGFDTLASEASSNVATYDSDQRVWLFRSGGGLMPISFPASATGESMDKPGARRIGDQEGTGDPVIRSRLSGPATVWIDAAESGRAYRTPEHNARALFGDRSEAGPGTELAGFAAELVYGLSTAWQRPRNSTALTSVVHLAETGALMGRMVGKRDADGTPSRYLQDDWPKLAQAIAERPQHLEAVTRTDTRQVAYTPAVLSDGLTFVARRTAVIKPPMDGLALLPDDERKGPRVADHGLDGGAFWGIEQRAFLEQLLRDPVSELGQMGGLAFGPFGTTGTQTARFVNGALSIITDTFQGRIASLQIEVSGRIGAFYHRAKHVVLYRRTTSASDQFEGLGGDSRRPILRKVREYIDIQEPIRGYPDRPNIDARTIGPLREIRFGTTRINVDSAWAETVGAHGWRVPLWNRHAADLRPVVYPMPSITAAMQGEDDERLTLQALRDPGKLCFYTNAAYAQAERDTNLWPAVHGVDGLDVANLNELAVLQDRRAMGDGLAAGRRAAASRFVPGAVAFTHCLSGSGGLTRVNEARGDRPVFAALESFAFMRGGGQQPVKNAAALLAASNTLDGFLDSMATLRPIPAVGPDPLKQIEAARTEFERLVALVKDGNLEERLAEEVRTAFQELQQTYNLKALDEKLTGEASEALKMLLDRPGFGAFRSVLQERSPKTLKDLIDGEALGDFQAIIKAEADQIASLDPAQTGALETALFGNKLAELRTTYQNGQDAYTKLKALLDADANTCEALAANAAAAIDGKKLLYGEQLRVMARDARALINAGSADQLQDKLNQLKLDVLASVAESTSRLGDEFGKVRALAKDARALVADWGGDVDRAYASGLERVAAFRNAYDSAKPWSPQRLDKVQASFEAELSNLQSEATAALTQTRQRFAAEIGAHAADATTVIDRILQKARTELESGSPAAKAAALLLGASTDQRNALLHAILEVNVAPLLTNLQAAIDAQGDAAQKSALEQVKADFEALRQTGQALGDAAQDQASKSAATLIRDLDAYAVQARSLIARANDANHALAAVDDALKTGLREMFGALGTTLDALVLAVRAVPGHDFFDAMITKAESWINNRAASVAGHVRKAQSATDRWLTSVEEGITNASNKMVGGLNQRIKDDLVDPLFTKFEAIIGASSDDLEMLRRNLLAEITRFEGTLSDTLNTLAGVATEIVGEARALCETLMAQKAALIEALNGSVKEFVKTRLLAYREKLGKLRDDIATAYADLGAVLDDATDALRDAATRGLIAFVRAAEQAAIGLAVIGAELADGIARLVAAAGKVPDIGGLGLNTDRVLAVFRDLLPNIDISLAFSSLGRLGDGLGSFNFDLPVIGLGEGFDLPDLNLPDLKDLLPDLNFEDLLPNFAGINFKDIVPDFGGAGNSFKDLKKWVKITHDVDKRAKTAWVKAELDLPFPKRAKLFGLGPFTLFLNKPKLIAWVRIEASAKTKDVTTTEHGEIRTDLEAVVAGQPMVTLRDVIILYTSDGGLDFKIDPSKIKLHPNFQFIQDVTDGLGLDFGDSGLAVLKDGNIPVGIEHKLALPLPPIAAGTSGVTNLTILNTFQLKAYPDFYIANKFNLSTREQPFVFSIFIIGGTGFIELDVNHMPAKGQTTIVMTAGVGGSASLAFAFGPVSGGVFVTLTVILTYRKYLPAQADSQDAGLSVALELAIFGQVSLWGIATIVLRLSLSMTYHESGRIDANGRLSVTLRISRFFKLRYATSVKYRLRDGKSVTVQTSEVDVELDTDLMARAAKLKNARARLT